MEQILMARGAWTVANVCLGVKPQEKILIVTEAEKLNIAKAVATAVKAANANPILIIMEARERDGQEPPEPVAAAMKVSNGFVCVVGKSITHTQAVKDACAAGSRGIMLTQFAEKFMIHGGLEADFPAAARDCKAIAQAMGGAKHLRLTSPSGTDLTYSAIGRRYNAMYCMVEPGEFAPVPTVEANVSPVEGSAQGIIVADASVPYVGIGLLNEPITCKVEQGKIISIEGGEEAKHLLRDLESKNDPNVFNIAENGIGLNPKCQFVGFMLEDEGVYGSAHIGIGTSITLGGTVKAACHYDLIMHKASLEVDGKMILKDGEVLI